MPVRNMSYNPTILEGLEGSADKELVFESGIVQKILDNPAHGIRKFRREWAVEGYLQ